MSTSLFLSGLFAILIPYAAAVISPGPDFAMILRNSLMYSKRSGIMAALGITTGMLMHATYTLMGLGMIIHQSPLLFNLIRGLGAAYLLYIGWQSIVKSAPIEASDIDSKHSANDMTPFQAFKTGFLSNALNPMVIVFCITILSSIMDFSTPTYLQVIYIMSMGLVAFAWFSTVALVITRPFIRNKFLKMGKWIGRVTGGVLVSFGLKAFFLLIKAF
jgi:RhtB (resistance to homoserine/threonine) family protein